MDRGIRSDARQVRRAVYLYLILAATAFEQLGHSKVRQSYSSSADGSTRARRIGVLQKMQ